MGFFFLNYIKLDLSIVSKGIYSHLAKMNCKMKKERYLKIIICRNSGIIPRMPLCPMIKTRTQYKGFTGIRSFWGPLRHLNNLSCINRQRCHWWYPFENTAGPLLKFVGDPFFRHQRNRVLITKFLKGSPHLSYSICTGRNLGSIEVWKY